MTHWLVIKGKDLDDLELDDPLASVEAEIYWGDEPPFSNDGGLLQIPIGELLQVARTSDFNA